MEVNVAAFKAKSFLAETDKASMSYEVKRTRATWDPSLRIPGTNRSGGWRCPTGTRYGGQITDRFGRNCGWGVARRLANEISDLGERLENVSDRRRERRAQRAVGQAGAARREVAQRQGLVERAAGRAARVLEGDNAQAAPAAPAAPRQPRQRRAALPRRRGNLRQSEAARMQAEIDQPGGGASDVGRRPNAPAVRRRRAATVVAQEKPERQPTPAKKAPAKKAVAKKQPAKKAPAKKQPAKKAPVKKQSARPATPAPEPERPATPAMRPATPAAQRPSSQPNWDDFNDINFENGAEWRDLNAVFEDLYGDREWANAAGRQFIDDIVQQQVDSQIEGMDNPTIKDLEALVNRQETLRQEWQQSLNDAVERFKNEPDALRRAGFAKDIYDNNENLRAAVIKKRAFEAKLQQLREAEAQRPATPPRREPNAFDIADEFMNRRDFMAGANFREMFEAQGEDDIQVRVNRAEEAKRNGIDAARRRFNGEFGANAANDLEADPDTAMQRFENTFNELGRKSVEARQAARTANTNMKNALDAANGDKRNAAYLRARDEYRMKQREWIAASTEERAYNLFRPTLERGIINAQGRPRRVVPEEPSAEVAAKAEKRVKDAIFARQATLADYLDKRYGEGNAPWLEMTPERLKELNRLARTDNNAKQQLLDWARQMYQHDEIEGKGGRKYQIKVEGLTWNNGTISMSAKIYHKRPDGRLEKVGYSTRTLEVGGNPPYIYHNNMIIEVDAHKNAGIQTIYNQHSFMYAKAAGFERIGVNAAYDGPYVWGRIGFKGPIYSRNINNVKTQLEAWRQGRSSIIDNEEDAQILNFLVQKYERDSESVRHMDFIYAFSPGNKQREAEIMQWFKTYFAFDNGYFYLDENLISPDPRVNTNVRARRQR